ncbi:Prohead protease [uncultured Caudovirales phage]|uniref:Prohead protease n=1 Tax=uncultured Caudovirales phage TaxID=2100421 RepID=A0A6J5Q9B2_9CAUD|nr:Prohead protease [uncultured Caudovirales phage]
MRLEFSSSIESSDTERRVIAGVVVPFNQIGNTSAGPVMFAPGSIAIHETAKVKLLHSHQTNAILGRAQSFKTTPEAIYGSFKISNSTAGQDALVMASEDLISGLSIGVDVTSSEPKDGYLLVKAARMVEVSLVENPAFTAAQVTRVAASESETVEIPNPTPTETESEAIVENTPAAVTPEVEAAPVVEASRPIIKPAWDDSQRVRHGITSAGAYTMHKIKAQLGNEESKLWVTAADDFSSAGLGFTPTQYLRDIVTTSNFGRPAVDAVSKQALPAFGMTINRPKFTTYPVSTVELEGGAVQNTDAVSEYLTSSVSKYSGMQTLSIELLERSDPGFYDAITQQLQLSYLKVTDAAVITALNSGTIGTKDYAATSAGIIDFISTEAPLAYSASSFFATNYLCGVSQWSLLIGAVDSTGRPIYSASQPMNAAGQSNVSSIKGNVLGLDLFVDKNVTATTIDNSSYIIAPEALTVFESPTAYMSVNVVSNLQVQVAIYGYMATMLNIAGGIRRFNVA